MIAGLPYDAEVEYLESTGTQWIDTGVNISDNDFVLSCDMRSTSRGQSATWARYFGSYVSESTTCTRIINYSGNDNYLYGAYRSRASNQTQLNGLGDYTERKVYVLSYNRLDVIHNGATQSIIMSKVQGTEDTSTVCLFGAKMACYGFQITHSGSLIIDFVPVRFTNSNGQSEGAMYDRVSRKLFRNAGTGAFIVGPDVATPVMGLHFFKSQIKTAKDYVQNGLVAMWDGIENAGWGVHDAAATTWKNLVGTSSGADIAVTAGYFLDNALAVTGSNYNQTAGAIPSATELTTEVSFTIPSVSRASGSIFAWRFTIGGPYFISTAWGYLRVTGGGNGNYGNDDNSYDLTPYIGNEFRASMANFIGQNGLYVNGAIARPSFVSQVGTDDRYRTNLYTGGQSEIRFHSVRVYNRLLSGAEISANSAIDKVRFNLP